MTESLLLNMTDVATALSISPSKAYTMMRSGVLPAFYIGKNLRISRAALLRWIAEQEGRALVVGGNEESFRHRS